MLCAPNIRVVAQPGLDELQNRDPVLGVVEEDDVDRGVVDGHPVYTDERFHVQLSRLVREDADVVKGVGRVAVACYEGLISASYRVDTIGPTRVLDCRDVGRVPLVANVLSGLSPEICSVA